MTMATLIKENILIGWPTVSEVQTLNIMVGHGGMQAGRHGARAESPTS